MTGRNECDKKWQGGIGRLLLLPLLLLFFLPFSGAGQTAFAEDRWEERDGKWYFYADTAYSAETSAPAGAKEAGESAGAARYTGWVQGKDGAWYYCRNSRMLTGWITTGGKWYFLHEDGRMAENCWIGNFYVGTDGAALKDGTAPDGEALSVYGSWIKNGKAVQELNYKTAQYISVLAEHPDARAEFTAPAQLVLENEDGFQFITYKLMKLYDRESGALLYSGDACFRTDAVLEWKEGEPRTSGPWALLGKDYILAEQICTDPAGYLCFLSEGELA